MIDKLNRLTDLSEKYRDPIAEIDWEKADPSLPWLPFDILSVSGSDLGLTEAQQTRFSQIEFARLCAAGIWLEGLLISRLSARGFLDAPTEETRIMLQEIREETGHSLMFLRMIERAEIDGSKLLGPTRLLTWVAQKLNPDDADFWAMVYIGETVTDTFGLQALRRASDPKKLICPVAEEVLSLHHKDEARHIAAARTLLQARIDNMSALRRWLFGRTLKFLLQRFLHATLYPTPASLAAIGIENPKKCAAEIRKCPKRLELARTCATPAINLISQNSRLSNMTPMEIKL
ncbi:MAG: diiron oxygenase [Rhodospirillales bacterium]